LAEIDKIRKFEGPANWAHIDTLCECFDQLDIDNDREISLPELQLCQAARTKRKRWLTGDDGSSDHEHDMTKGSINHDHHQHKQRHYASSVGDSDSSKSRFDYKTWDLRMPALIAAVKNSDGSSGQRITKDVFVRILCKHEHIHGSGETRDGNGMGEDNDDSDDSDGDGEGKQTEMKATSPSNVSQRRPRAKIII
jgi:hypothetical protein